MFTSQMHFPHSSSTYSPILIGPSIVLFPRSFADNSSLLDKPSIAACNLPDSATNPPLHHTLLSLLMNLAPNPFSLSDMINWMLGSVANRSFDEITLAAPFILAGGATLFATRRGLSALTLGEEAAAGIGLNLRRQQIFTVVGAGLATGGAVALAGAIGFVGIVAPHIIRPFVGHDPARSLVPSALFSGLILVVADIFVRLMPTSAELKLGVVAALIGAPAFVWIAMQRRTGND